MKEDFDNCPLWVMYNGLIVLEMFRKNSLQASNFLVAISEPVSRTENMHEYQITAYSLYAATSVGLDTDQITNTLQKFSKNYLPKSIKNFITDCTLSYGKLKLIRSNYKYFIEAANENVYNFITADEIIKAQIIMLDALNLTFEIQNVEIVKKRCIEIDYPLLDEYDFLSDKENKNNKLEMDLKPSCHIRSYQEACLNKLFGNGRARSGIIVLPCGSGKTLVGITAISTIKKSAIILCTSAVSVEQWRQAILGFSTVNAACISRFTSDKKEWFVTEGCDLEKQGIFITTYSMLSFSGKRSYDSQLIMDKLKTHEWGLMILDEVHVVPAQMFRKVLENVSHKCKLGLTATLVREDDKIEDLNFLIGPKLYEADWQDLSEKGHIAKVEGAEV